MFVFDKNYVLNSDKPWFADKLDNNFRLVVDENKSIVAYYLVN